MHVLVFKVSKEIQIVPDYRTAIEFFSATSESVPFVDMDRDVMIDKQVWPIRKFSRYECEPSNVGMPRELQQGRRIDTYVAIDPELEKFVAIPYEQQVNEIAGKLNSERTSRMQRELEIDTWWQQPWYNRLWLALKGTT